MTLRSTIELLSQLSSVQWYTLYHSLGGKAWNTCSPRTKVEEQTNPFDNSKNNIILQVLSYLVGDSLVTLPLIKSFAYYCIVTIVGPRFPHCCLFSGLVLSPFHRRITTTSHGSKQWILHYILRGLVCHPNKPSPCLLQISPMCWMVASHRWYLSHRGFHPLKEGYTSNTYVFLKDLPLLNN